ncbi:metal-sulfur cluster assembly factor [Hippea alviniae]|uniref:metal-sulfur cluster assembly factor n=1 Tax=Hippea alviniae TaxID=1279027 RepID=UPI0003B37DF5|nr:metal-sulfur cluster assembly factor [Hippea alviniae]
MSIQEKVIEKLKTVYDPELREDVVKLKLVYDLKVDEENGIVDIKFRPTVENCPVGLQLAIAIKKAILSVEGVKRANVKVENFIWAKEAEEFLKALDK